MSFEGPDHRPRRHWSEAGERARAGQARTRAKWRWAEFRLVVLLGLFLGLSYAGLDMPREGDPESEASSAPIAASFALCHSGGGWNCVVDGDTIYAEGVKVRVADIDAPETHPPRCAEEARLGEAATLRMQALLSDEPFTMAAIDRDEDRYGRKLRVVMRGGESLGDILVAEGLAGPNGGGRQAWC